jgi:hemoglobin
VREESTVSQTIFERYGGFAKVSRIVSSFYDSAVDSPLLCPYFQGIDMARLVDHQAKFISSLMGGPASYSDEEIRRVHAHLSVTDEAFDEMTELLEETLEDFGMNDDDIAAVMKEIGGRRHLIVTSG